MERILNLKFNKAFLIILAFFLVLNIGLGFSAHMVMDDHGTGPCPYMGIASLCTMNPLQHLSEWQSMFSTPLKESTTLLFLLSLSVVLVWLFNQYLLKPPRTFSQVFFSHKHKEKVFNQLELAFARGLIHSKAY